MSIAFEELEGSPTIRIAEQGTVAVRAFRIAWDDWPAFARLLVGDYQLVGGRFVFTAPLEFPAWPNLFVDELAVTPFDGGNPQGDAVTSLSIGTNRYPAAGARVTATYRTLSDPVGALRGDLPAVPEGTFLLYDTDFDVELQPLPGRIWHWVTAGNPSLLPDQSPRVFTPTGTFRLAWRRVPLPPWTAIAELRGCVNDATFLGSPPGTVLFLGARALRQFPISPSGGFWTIRYSFAERSTDLGASVATWNHFYKETPVSGAHWVAIADDSDNPPYRSGDFSRLFTFEPS